MRGSNTVNPRGSNTYSNSGGGGVSNYTDLTDRPNQLITETVTPALVPVTPDLDNSFKGGVLHY
jgi:hypothetical protein